MRLLQACTAALLFAASASAQTARVSGRVIDGDRGTPIAGASVRLTGASMRATDSLGRFEFTDVVPGRYIVTVTSIGYRLQSVHLTIQRDTALSISMTRRVVSLDTMVVRPKYLRLKGTAVDSASGDALMQAQATLYPGSRFVGALSGVFNFDSVAPGPVTIIVEGAEHLPVRLEFDASRDTAFRVKMAVDSVALRMIKLQVMRLQQRAQSAPYSVRSFNREAIGAHHVSSIGLFLDRKVTKPIPPRIKARLSAMDACYFIDDNRVEPAMFDSLEPELIERAEVYKDGGMVRVYTKRYVASLINKTGLQKLSYMPIGLRPSCH
jgi:hypothetical protein